MFEKLLSHFALRQSKDSMSDNDLSQAFQTLPKATPETDKHMSTLLDKALTYRMEHTETWEARERDRDEQFLETYGIYQEDPFLAAYYKKQDERVRKKKKDQAKRKLESPQIVAKLQYTLAAETEEVLGLSESSDSLDDAFRRESLKSESDVNETDIFKMSPSRQLHKSQSSKLTITIVKGKYLLNWLGAFQRKYDSCKIKCTLQPKCKRNGKKAKTRDTYVNLKGTARYNHVFRIQGFSPEELEQRHIVFEVSGKNNQRKDLIGKVVLGGLKSTINDSNLNCRGPTEVEYTPWQKAIENPGTIVDVRMVVRRPQDEMFFAGETNTLLNRSQLLKSSPRLTRNWANRSPIKKSKLNSL